MGVRAVWSEIAREWRGLQVLRSAGAIPALRRLPGIAWETLRSGPAAGGAILGHLHGDRVAIIDREGALTYRELGTLCSAATVGLRSILRGEDRPVIAIMTRNSRHTFIALLSALGVGAKVVAMNTDMGGKQIDEVCTRERVRVLIYDEAFEERLQMLGPDITRVIAARSTPDRRDDTLATLIARAPTGRPQRPTHKPQMVILTSGSTGAPKGSSRTGGNGQRPSVAGGAGFFEKIPFRPDDIMFLAPPVYHGWGAICAGSALALGATLVLEPGFDAASAVELIAKHRCTALVMVPTMIRRLLALGHDALAPIDHKAIRIIGSGGARLEGSLVEAVRDEFGSVLHNLYGATEAAFISIATPTDLIADPESAGSPPTGVTVKVYAGDTEAAVGEVGDIYVGSFMTSPQYTDGRRKETRGNLIKTGDTGYFNQFGRLFVIGRSDGMIVSGGENVFPEEVEGTLLAHPDIKDAKVVPVADADFGQRLKAYVVLARTPGPSPDEIKTYVSQELSRSRVPRDVVYVNDLRRTGIGKVTKSTLDELDEQQLAADLAPETKS
ncbi:AMP-binding protein [Mycobacteroides abscessus]|uniref:AMP-binding protein n=1 Tax=Mycobacteroides abscessus TaxID=36809 RepID=UPI0009297AE1|nr:AMP-binding protein [Mycobacteroides abscessus]SKS08289.1 putative fatty-acid-CoA ligase FadD [Mycobacteroides abscessus subsp. abscessus]SHU86789.1 putative fatty-acid-CoA ligase FadD [Mycobacteroides abscessus subsp. bolletii]SHW21976.1 putative fatty-acid-CoA ligase FadD [Mycobacteroides abscessus subsp. bolletii]SHW47724.1 putative fatty-acid-CoA ligase FadD [Mycobacteroides abscessus subsp. bolletii]SHX92091.1 putative fatty-acid-CoA ligase FadD [Mycobacteroides abscessus subsp. bollet